MKFYKSLKFFAILTEILFTTAFIYTLVKGEFIDKIILCGIFILCISVCSFLIYYYKNAIVKINFNKEFVELISADNIVHSYKCTDCIQIINDSSTKIYFKFNDNKTYYFIKRYYFKNTFDSSIVDNQHFPNAKIQDYYKY